VDLTDLEAKARSVLPDDVYAYYRAGADAEITLGEQEHAWASIRLRPRVLNDVSSIDTSTTLLGLGVTSPVAVAPTALQVLAHDGGEVETASGVREAGSLLVLSTRSGRRLDDVAAVGAPFWQQVYVMQDRGISDEIARAAAEAGAQALVITVDTAHVTRKAVPIPVTAQPTRLLPSLETLDERAQQAADVVPADIARLADVSGLPVVVKGVLRGDDARRCVEVGAAGVIVSTHGGRQLDRVVPVPRALPEVVAAVGSDVEVYADGGVRSGLDVLAALALGARAVFVGRPVLWALAAGGAAQVEDLLDRYRSDLADKLALAGVRSVSQISSDLIAT